MLSAISASTGADGTYTITGSSTTELPTGDFRVSVAEPGWSDEGDGVAYVDVADDSGATADLALRQIAVTVTITLPDQLNENITDATVTRVESAEEGRVECALRFDDLDIYIEQRIVRWVFSEQRRVAERRAAVRVPVEVPAWCEPAAGGDQFKARTIDLAGDGARIVTDRALVPGDRVHIQLDVDEPAYRVACVAEVVWANMVGDERWAYGLRFHGLDRPTQRQIVDHAIANEQRRTAPAE